MQVFKLFFQIVKKHLTAIIIYTGLYIFLMLLLSTTAQDTMEDYFVASKVDISVVDRDHSEASKALTNYLGEVHNLIPVQDDEETIQDFIYYRYVRYVLIIEDGFEEKLKAQDTEGLLSNVMVPGSQKGLFIDSQVNNYVKNLEIYLAGGYEMKEAILQTQTSAGQVSEVEILHFDGAEAGGNENVAYFFRYLPYIFILILICGLSPIILILNKQEVYERTLCSCITLMKRNRQLIAGCICYSAVVYVVFVLLSIAICGKEMFHPQAVYYLINSAVFLLFSLALTLFISIAFVVKDYSLHLAGNIIGLGMCFLSGVFVPKSMLPESVLQVSRFLPAYWYIENNDMLGGLSEQSFSISSFWMAAGIQLLFALALFAAALVASKVRLKRN